MQNERGFTLVEILVSVVILGLLATVFFQFFVFSQKTTTSNQEKLVALNVAQGVLERIKHGGYPEITEPAQTESSNYPKEYSCRTHVDECESKYKLIVNNRECFIKVIVSKEIKQNIAPDGTGQGLGIHEVEVRVYDDENYNDDDKPQSSVKGFVEI